MSPSQQGPAVRVVVIDNIGEQARNVQRALEKDPSVEVLPLVVNVNAAQAAEKTLPASVLDRVLGEIDRLKPDVVLVDTCLHEAVNRQVFPVTSEPGAWTGPELMSVIKTRCPGVRVASYSAYPAGHLANIIPKGQLKHVDPRRHWSVNELGPDCIRAVMKDG